MKMRQYQSNLRRLRARMSYGVLIGHRFQECDPFGDGGMGAEEFGGKSFLRVDQSSQRVDDAEMGVPFFDGGGRALRRFQFLERARQGKRIACQLGARCVGEILAPAGDRHRQELGDQWSKNDRKEPDRKENQYDRTSASRSPAR